MKANIHNSIHLEKSAIRWIAGKFIAVKVSSKHILSVTYIFYTTKNPMDKTLSDL